MKELKASTKAGKNIIERASYFDGRRLEDVYTSYSVEKARAYEWCFNEYMNTEDSRGFQICSHNTFGFTCAWYGTRDGEPILRYETKDNTYIVWLDR